jgi:glycosyltransferase involved in cell wall biosynthesis
VTFEHTATVGIVVIGRNEGGRLARCLRSVGARGTAGAVVYVDSGSFDGSVGAARSLGAEVVELDGSKPFSAARARNEGLERLLEISPAARFVQFVDGDCEVVNGWIGRAGQELATRSDVAAVCGRLRERFPEQSIYNRLCDLEWNATVGEVKACGGIAMYRIDDLTAAGGFDPTVAAGEEPELCMRLRRLGRRIVRLPDEMALHDAAMLRFGQWWKRQVRGGYGGLDIVSRFDPDGKETSFARQLRSARLWGIGWPVAIVLAAVAGAVVDGWRGALIGAGVAAMVAPLQVIRIAIQARRKGLNGKAALAHGALTLVGKWASVLGQWRYWRGRRAGRSVRPTDEETRPAAVPGAAAMPLGEGARP